MPGFPRQQSATRLEAEVYISRCTTLDALNDLGALGIGKNLRGMKLAFAVDDADIPHEFGVDVVVQEGANVAQENIMFAGILLDDLLTARGRIQGRWVRILLQGFTDRIFMTSGNSETNVITLWSRQGEPLGLGTHQFEEIRAKRRNLLGVCSISETPATINMQGGTGVNSSWEPGRPVSDPTLLTSPDVPGGVPVALERFVGFSPMGAHFIPTDMPAAFAISCRRAWITGAGAGYGI